jgi:hypothetical protein
MVSHNPLSVTYLNPYITEQISSLVVAHGKRG